MGDLVMCPKHLDYASTLSPRFTNDLDRGRQLVEIPALPSELSREVDCSLRYSLDVRNLRGQRITPVPLSYAWSISGNPNTVYKYKFKVIVFHATTVLLTFEGPLIILRMLR
ncbi:hypothetical protein CSKR_202987, partial [Clonorchis sinensis]